MTIAACYLSTEGVVFGADSTTTMFVPGPRPEVSGAIHHYNFAQKIFQIGENSTLAMTMWGLGNLRNISYRTLIAQFADLLVDQGAQLMEDVANRWNQFFWNAYSSEFVKLMQRAQQLRYQQTRTPKEENELDWLLRNFSGGFCIGGYLTNDHNPAAFEILYDPTLTSPGPVSPLSMGSTRFWGCPNLVGRLIYGIDESLFSTILQSGKWSGSHEELFDLIQPYCLGQPFDLPIREAIDWVHGSIYTYNKDDEVFAHGTRLWGAGRGSGYYDRQKIPLGASQEV